MIMTGDRAILVNNAPVMSVDPRRRVRLGPPP
jgi:hypothetical protein